MTRSDEGSAIVEFVAVTVVLLIPLLYLLDTAITLQRAAFGVDEGAREAGRALTLAGSTPAGFAEARAAAQIALRDQGVTAVPDLRVTRSGCTGPAVLPVLTPGARYDVCLSVRVALPFTSNRVLGSFAAASVTVRGEYVMVVNPYQAQP